MRSRISEYESNAEYSKTGSPVKKRDEESNAPRNTIESMLYKENDGDKEMPAQIMT